MSAEWEVHSVRVKMVFRDSAYRVHCPVADRRDTSRKITTTEVTSTGGEQRGEWLVDQY